MLPSQFDSFARALGRGVSRRSLIGAAMAGSLGIGSVSSLTSRTVSAQSGITNFKAIATGGHMLIFPALDVSAYPYDPNTHKWREDYVYPKEFRIGLDARDSLLAASSSSGVLAVSIDLGLPQQVPLTLEDFLNWSFIPAEPSDPPVLPPGGLFPDYLDAYEWKIVRNDDGTTIFNEIEGENGFVFAILPGPGYYIITCRAIFNDGRPSESTTMIYHLQNPLIASIGDSFASGEGNPDLDGEADSFYCDSPTFQTWVGNESVDDMETDPVWLEPLAHRSLKSGPSIAALAIAGDHHEPGTDSVYVDNVVTFVSVARSGAGIIEGLLSPQGGDDDFIDANQIEELRRTVGAREVDALLISIGGNDAGFADVLIGLVEGDFGEDDDDNRQEILDRALENLGIGLPAGQVGPVEDAFDSLKLKLDSLQQSGELVVRETYISTYPNSLFETESGGFESCGLFRGIDLDLDSKDNDVVKELGNQLNALIKRKGEAFGWHVLDLDATEAFARKGYCTADDIRVWRQATESCEIQGDFEGVLHPNEEGHRIYGFYLAEQLREHSFGPGPGFEPGGSDAGAVSTATQEVTLGD